MMSIAHEIVIVLLLVLANGIFAMAEIAVISSRKARLKQLADEGDSGARTALEMANSPGRFLSTVQVGITLIGIIAGAFGGATIADELAVEMAKIQFIAPYSDAISVIAVVVAITYLSLVVGELAPKQVALTNPERIAAAIAPAMRTLSNIASPIVKILNHSAGAVVRILGVRKDTEPPVTEEEIRTMIAQGTRVGIFDPLEEELVDRVFRIGDRRIDTLITPRTEIIWLDLDDTPEEIYHKITASRYSQFPVARGSLDNVVGIVSAKDLLAQSLIGGQIDIKAVMRTALFVPEGVLALEVLERFKQNRCQIALILDEYSGLQGLVTANDVLEEIVGSLPEMDEATEPEAVQREDGSWLVDGMMPTEEFKAIFQIKQLPREGERTYQTLGGFIMTSMERIPSAGDHFKWERYRFEVVDMDRHRVDKVLVIRLNSPDSEE